MDQHYPYPQALDIFFHRFPKRECRQTKSQPAAVQACVPGPGLRTPPRAQLNSRLPQAPVPSPYPLHVSKTGALAITPGFWNLREYLHPAAASLGLALLAGAPSIVPPWLHLALRMPDTFPPRPPRVRPSRHLFLPGWCAEQPLTVGHTPIFGNRTLTALALWGLRSFP